MRYLFTWCVVALFFTVSFSQASEAQPGKSRYGLLERLDRLVKELEVIEKKQEEIRAEQTKTVEQIKNLKIWSRG